MHLRSDDRPRRRASCQRGFTLLEVAIAASLVTFVTVVTLAAVSRLGETSDQGVCEQEVARVGGSILERIAKELRYAEADSIQFAETAPDRITFQEALAYEADPSTEGSVIVSRPVTLRHVAIANATGRFGVERSEGAWLSGDGDDKVAICITKDDGDQKTKNVKIKDLADYLAEGATIGPCGSEPMPVSPSPFGVPPTVFGGAIAARDLEHADLPGLNFAVRPPGDPEFVDVAVTVFVRSGASEVRRRFATSVALVNRNR